MKVVVDRIVVAGLTEAPNPAEFRALVAAAIGKALPAAPAGTAEIRTALAAAVARTAGARQ